MDEIENAFNGSAFARGFLVLIEELGVSEPLPAPPRNGTRVRVA